MRCVKPAWLEWTTSCKYINAMLNSMPFICSGRDRFSACMAVIEKYVSIGLLIHPVCLRVSVCVSRCSAGELSSQNKIKLDAIFVSLSEITAKARGLEADVKGTLGEHAEALESLNGDYTPINMTRALQTGLKECGG